MITNTAEARELVKLHNQAASLCTRLWDLRYAQPFNFRVVDALKRASARSDRRLIAWREYVASGKNDDWSVAA
jgi:hypothetical protein